MATLFPVGSHVVLQDLQEGASQQYNGKVAIVESTVVGEHQRVRLLRDVDDIDDEDEQEDEEGKVLDVRQENLKATFYPIGSHVVLHGLQAASHHNEKIAIVESTVGERQRVRLFLPDINSNNNEDEGKQFLDVKPENLKQAKFYPTGSRVILHGLQAASYYKYNGKIAVVVESLSGERQRVRLMDDEDNDSEGGKVLDVRPRNLKANFHSIGIHVIPHGLRASREQYNGKIGVVESTVGERQRVRLLLDDDDDGNVRTMKVLHVLPENLKANVYPIQSRVILQGLQGTSKYKYNGKVAIVESTVGERQCVRLLLDENDKDNTTLHVWPENLKLAPKVTETTAKQNLQNIIKQQQQQQQQQQEKENKKKQKTKQPSRSTNKQANIKSNDDDCTEGICCCLCAILGVAALVLAADSSKSPEPLPMPAVRETTTPTSNPFYSGLRPVSSGYTTSPPYSQSMDRGTYYNGGTYAAAHVSQSQSRQAAEEARAQEALRQAEAQCEATMRQCDSMNRATSSASRRMASSHSMNIADQMKANRQQHASRMMNDMNRDQQATWDRIHGARSGSGGRSSGQASWDRINDTINRMNPNVVYSHTYTSDL